MTQEKYNSALAAAESLADLPEDELLRELGQRIEATEKLSDGQVKAQEFNPGFPDTSSQQGWDFFKDVGKRWYAKIETELMRFICDKNNPDRNMLTSGKTVPQIAASLATAGIVAAIAAPPAWLIVATTILASKLAETSLDALCEVYYERNPAK